MGTKRRTLGTAMVAMTAVLGLAWATRAPEPVAVATTDPAPTTTTVPDAPAVSASTLPPLPVPHALPDDPHAPTPPIVLGTIEIPKLEVTAELQQGITLTAINRGPGHWPGTPLPGGLGNMVVAGHRTTYTKPFERLDELVAGDLVVFTTPQGRFTYEVRGTIVVPERNVGLASQSYAHTATLFACHPKGKATHRIVAKLRLLRDDGTPVDPDESLPPMDVGLRETDTTFVHQDPGPAPDGDPLAGIEG